MGKRQGGRRSRLLRLLCSTVLAGSGILGAVGSAWAAESVEFIYGKLRARIQVSSLETLVNDNRIEPDLRLYARLLEPNEISEIRSILGEPANVNTQIVFSFLNSPQGNTILHYLAQILRNSDQVADVPALREALATAASGEEGLSLLSVLQSYPATNLQIDIGQAVGVVQRIEQVMAIRRRALSVVASQFRQERNRAFVAFPPDPAEVPPDLIQSGPYAWSMRSVRTSGGDRPPMLIDLYWPSRPNPQLGIQSNIVDSTQPPTKKGSETPRPKHPVIVISHGLASNRQAFSYLAEHLVSHGFIVAVPEHKGSDTAFVQALLDGLGSEIADPQDFVNRSKDVSRTLNLLEVMGPQFPGLVGTIDFENVGIIGHSFGGYTALAAAGAELDFEHLKNQCTNDILIPRPNPSLLLQCQAMFVKPFPTDRFVSLQDDRITAAIAVNPISSYLFGTQGLKALNVPTAIIASSDDTITPPLSEQFYPFTQMRSLGKKLFVMVGANHFSVLLDKNSDVFNLPNLGSTADPKQYRTYFKTLSAAFMERHLRNSRGGDRYLDPRQNGRILSNPRQPLYSLSRLRPDQLPNIAPTTPDQSTPDNLPLPSNFGVFQQLRQRRQSVPTAPSSP
ncbi:MAG: alpha/beta fold hydrolase [Cyanobacteria bacterium P01_D01_bin.73]